jgi:transcriptional regulator with XRE-family HTH domain
MTDRFKLLLEQLHISPSGFADKIGVQRSSVSHIFSGRNKPSIDFLEKILNVYPDIDVNWLITGKVSSPEAVNKIPPDPDPEPDLFQELNAPVHKKEAKQKDIDNVTENKLLAAPDEDPVEKIILVFKNGTFRILRPSEN